MSALPLSIMQPSKKAAPAKEDESGLDDADEEDISELVRLAENKETARAYESADGSTMLKGAYSCCEAAAPSGLAR
jgi:hypothetical protein